MTNEIEIIPPEEPHVRFGKVTVSGVPKTFTRVVMPMQPGSPVPSGHWWAIITGRGNALQGGAPDGWVQLRLNDQTLEFPIGVWAVMDNNKFQVAKQSDLPMMWYDGQDLKEKTETWERRGRYNTPYRVLGERLVQANAALPPA